MIILVSVSRKGKGMCWFESAFFLAPGILAASCHRDGIQIVFRHFVKNWTPALPPHFLPRLHSLTLSQPKLLCSANSHLWREAS